MHLMKIVFVEDSIAAWSVVPWEVPATEHPHANLSILIWSHTLPQLDFKMAKYKQMRRPLSAEYGNNDVMVRQNPVTLWLL